MSKDFPLPLLNIHGADDKITSPKASEEFFAKVPSTVQWKIHKKKPKDARKKRKQRKKRKKRKQKTQRKKRKTMKQRKTEDNEAKED